MFDLNDKELIMQIISNKSSTDIVIPLYVKIYNAPYAITELDEINECSHSVFKVGFGSMDNIYTLPEAKFPMNRLQEFYNPNVISKFNEETQVNNMYVTFESDGTSDDDTSKLAQEINKYCQLLFDYISKIVSEKKAVKRQLIVDDEDEDDDEEITGFTQFNLKDSRNPSTGEWF